MWDVKSNVIPIIITTIRIISKSLKKYLSSIPQKHEIEKQHTTAMLGTAQCTILRKVLMSLYKNIGHRK